MFKKLFTLLSLVSLLFLGFSQAFAEENSNSNKKKFKCEKASDGGLTCYVDTTTQSSSSVVLTTKNTVVLRGLIDGKSVSSFIRDFHRIENSDEVDTIYVYIRSGGGSIFAGDKITEVISSSRKEVVAVIDVAASMAFHIAQYADHKLVLQGSIMMQHHAAGSPSPGEFPNVDKQWDFLKRKVEEMNRFEANACTNVSYDEFKANIDRDWWLLSPEAVATGCADDIVESISCSNDLMIFETSQVFRVFGLKIEITWSGCPLEIYPRKVSVSKLGDRFASITEGEYDQVRNFMLLLTDPLTYYTNNGTFNLIKQQP